MTRKTTHSKPDLETESRLLMLPKRSPHGSIIIETARNGWTVLLRPAGGGPAHLYVFESSRAMLDFLSHRVEDLP